MKKPKNIIFDVGDVLLDYRWQQMLMDYGLDEAEAYRVGRELFDDPDGLWHEYDLGVKSQEEIIQEFEQKHPKDAEVIRWFISHGEYMHVARPAIWKLVHQLKEVGYHLYILSNYPEILFKKHTQYADFMDDMEGMVVSYMLHVGKPERVVYQTLCDRYGLNKEECLFFDDRAENVQGAIDFGMRAKRVLSAKELAADLEELLRLE